MAPHRLPPQSRLHEKYGAAAYLFHRPYVTTVGLPPQCCPEFSCDLNCPRRHEKRGCTLVHDREIRLLARVTNESMEYQKWQCEKTGHNWDQVKAMTVKNSKEELEQMMLSEERRRSQEAEDQKFEDEARETEERAQPPRAPTPPSRSNTRRIPSSSSSNKGNSRHSTPGKCRERGFGKPQGKRSPDRPSVFVPRTTKLVGDRTRLASLTPSSSPDEIIDSDWHDVIDSIYFDKRLRYDVNINNCDNFTSTRAMLSPCTFRNVPLASLGMDNMIASHSTIFTTYHAYKPTQFQLSQVGVEGEEFCSTRPTYPSVEDTAIININIPYIDARMPGTPLDYKVSDQGSIMSRESFIAAPTKKALSATDRMIQQTCRNAENRKAVHEIYKFLMFNLQSTEKVTICPRILTGQSCTGSSLDGACQYEYKFASHSFDSLSQAWTKMRMYEHRLPIFPNKHDRFDSFADLPGEIRNQIWLYAIKDAEYECAIQLRDVTNSQGIVIEDAIVPLKPAPSLLHVCQESRDLGLTVWEKTLASEGSIDPLCYIRFEKDRLFLHARSFEEFETLMNQLRKEDLARVEVVALPLKVFRQNDHEALRGLSLFPKLRQAKLVAGDRRDMHIVRGKPWSKDASFLMKGVWYRRYGRDSSWPTVKLELIDERIAHAYGIDDLRWS